MFVLIIFYVVKRYGYYNIYLINIIIMNIDVIVYKIYKLYFNRSDIIEIKRGSYENRVML